MGYKEYLESVERTTKEQAEMRHHFFAQHPELIGVGLNPFAPEEERPEEPEPQVITKTYVRIDAQALELQRKLKDIDNILQEHLKFHRERQKKGGKY